MGNSKVEYNGETLIDISNDTVTPETLAKGETAHNSNGEPIVGTAMFNGDGDEEVKELYIFNGFINTSDLTFSTDVSLEELVVEVVDNGKIPVLMANIEYTATQVQLYLSYGDDEHVVFTGIFKQNDKNYSVSVEMYGDGTNNVILTEAPQSSGPFIIKAYADFLAYKLTNVTDKAGNTITFAEIEEAYNRGDHIIIDIDIEQIAPRQRLLANLTVFRSNMVAVFDQTMMDADGSVIFVRGLIYYDNTTGFTSNELVTQSQLNGLTFKNSTSVPTVDDRSVITFVIEG